MTTRDASSSPLIDIEGLGFDAGAHLLIQHALAALAQGQSLRVRGTAPGWDVQLEEWCRSQGHLLQWENEVGETRSALIAPCIKYGRWRDALRTGHSDPCLPEAVAERALPGWGLAAR